MYYYICTRICMPGEKQRTIRRAGLTEAAPLSSHVTLIVRAVSAKLGRSLAVCFEEPRKEYR
jgi:hypothetical protein